jgi:hypothetical protein
MKTKIDLITIYLNCLGLIEGVLYKNREAEILRYSEEDFINMFEFETGYKVKKLNSMYYSLFVKNYQI